MKLQCGYNVVMLLPLHFSFEIHGRPSQGAFRRSATALIGTQVVTTQEPYSVVTIWQAFKFVSYLFSKGFLKRKLKRRNGQCKETQLSHPIRIANRVMVIKLSIKKRKTSPERSCNRGFERVQQTVFTIKNQLSAIFGKVSFERTSFSLQSFTNYKQRFRQRKSDLLES